MESIQKPTMNALLDSPTAIERVKFDETQSAAVDELQDSSSTIDVLDLATSTEPVAAKQCYRHWGINE